MNARHHYEAPPTKKAGAHPRDRRPQLSRNRDQITRSGRRFPPYLKRHAQRLQENPGHPVFIFVGADAWAAVKRCYIGCVCPLDEDPAVFYWSALRACPVFIIGAGPVPEEAVHALGLELLRVGIPAAVFAGEGEGDLWAYTEGEA